MFGLTKKKKRRRARAGTETFLVPGHPDFGPLLSKEIFVMSYPFVILFSMLSTKEVV